MANDIPNTNTTKGGCPRARNERRGELFAKLDPGRKTEGGAAGRARGITAQVERRQPSERRHAQTGRVDERDERRTTARGEQVGPGVDAVGVVAVLLGRIPPH